MKSDIYFMRHCLAEIIPTRELSEALNTSTARGIKVLTSRKKSMKKVCSKSSGPTDVWMQPTPSSDEQRSNCFTAYQEFPSDMLCKAEAML